jgi:tRNA G46 methylase TrmB
MTIKTANIKFMRHTAGYSLLDYRRNEDIFKEIKVGKGKVIPMLNKAPHHKDILGVEVEHRAFLTSALRGVSCQFHALTALSLGKEDWYTMERRPGEPHRASLYAGEKRQIPSP